MGNFWFLLLLLFRTIINPLIVQTYFNPDEYWQSIEIAHKIVYDGIGIETWEWKQGIRGYVHPLIFAMLYYLLKFLHLDSAYSLILFPKILQGVFQFVTDVYIYKLTWKWFRNERIAKCALICNVTNWFIFYCGVRTFSNSMETTFSVLALYYYPSPSLLDHKKYSKPLKLIITETWKWLFWVGFACAVRPTNALMWLPLGIYYLLQVSYKLDGNKITNVFVISIFGVVPVTLLWIGITIAIDSYMYGRFIFVIFNFLKFNLIEDRSHVYGVQPWHWYFSEGFPVMLLSHVILVAIGCYKNWKDTNTSVVNFLTITKNRMMNLVLWLLIAYSKFAHKEFRFVFPVLPLCMIYAGCGLHRLCYRQGEKDNTREYLSLSRKKCMLLILIFGLQLAMALYFSLVHQRGTLDVMHKLQHHTNMSKKDGKIGIYFLMPCHHTPGYSHLHMLDPVTRKSKVFLRHLDCSPQFDKPQNLTAEYIDEADQFYLSPEQFVKNRDEFHKIGSIPDFIIMYDDEKLHNELNDYLSQYGFHKIENVFHMFAPKILDKRMATHVSIYKRDGEASHVFNQ